MRAAALQSNAGQASRFGRDARATTARRSRRASCISASARSIARIRPSMSTTAWQPAKPAGASSARRCAAPTRATRSAPQDGLYTLAVREQRRREAARHRLDPVAAGRAGGPRALARRADAIRAIRIVTLTITEKAYLRNAARRARRGASRHRRTTSPIPDRPRTAHGFLAEALARRRAAGTPPFTVLCCDNLPANGATLRRVMLDFAALARRRRWRATSPTRWRFRRAWSTASCRRPPTPTERASPKRSASTTPGR